MSIPNEPSKYEVVLALMNHAFKQTANKVPVFSIIQNKPGVRILYECSSAMQFSHAMPDSNIDQAYLFYESYVREQLELMLHVAESRWVNLKTKDSLISSAALMTISAIHRALAGDAEYAKYFDKGGVKVRVSLQVEHWCGINDNRLHANMHACNVGKDNKINTIVSASF